MDLSKLPHQQWIAATIGGMLFAIALYRRGRVCDMVFESGKLRRRFLNDLGGS